MSKFDFDLFVIGAGSGGVRAARIAAGHGAKVGICEESRVGGTCVIRGCVPKKLLVYASHFADDFEDAAGYGWTVGETTFSWPDLIRAKDREIDRLNQVYLGLLSNAGVTLYEERGVLLDRHTVRVGDEKVTADKILIAVGGRPWKPEIPGIEHAITSDEAFHLDELPARVTVVGGGYIACEFAGIFAGLGSEVIQVYRGDALLRGFDSDVRRVVTRDRSSAASRYAWKRTSAPSRNQPTAWGWLSTPADRSIRMSFFTRPAACPMFAGWGCSMPAST
jgi:glutathione reductase (NADPH)